MLPSVQPPAFQTFHARADRGFLPRHRADRPWPRDPTPSCLMRRMPAAIVGRRLHRRPESSRQICGPLATEPPDCARDGAADASAAAPTVPRILRRVKSDLIMVVSNPYNKSMRTLLALCLFVPLGFAGSLPAPRERSFSFEYAVTVKDVPTGAHTVDIWLPVPHDDAFQHIANLRVETGYRYEIATGSEDNHFAASARRWSPGTNHCRHRALRRRAQGTHPAAGRIFARARYARASRPRSLSAPRPSRRALGRHHSPLGPRGGGRSRRQDRSGNGARDLQPRSSHREIR